jgi:glycopeptide antibiotics resistance protein
VSIVRRNLAIILAIGYIALLILLSVLPDSHTSFLYQPFGFSSPSVLHIPAFFGLALVLSILFKEFGSRHPMAWAAWTSLLLAVFVEYVQSNLPSRSATISDIGLGIVGIVLYAFWHVMLRYFRKRYSSTA